MPGSSDLPYLVYTVVRILPGWGDISAKYEGVPDVLERNIQLHQHYKLRHMPCWILLTQFGVCMHNMQRGHSGERHGQFSMRNLPSGDMESSQQHSVYCVHERDICNMGWGVWVLAMPIQFIVVDVLFNLSV